MLTLVFITLGSFLLVLQTSLFANLPAWIGNPDLLFLLVVFLAARMANFRGFFLTLILGLLMDIFSGVTPGLFPVLFGGLFLTIKFLSRQIIFDEPAHQPALAAISYLICQSIIYLYLLASNRDIDLSWSWHDLLLATLIQAVLALPLFQIFNYLLKTFSADRDRLWLPRRHKPANRFVR
jgi:rod shape-determining protein MreD